MKLFMISALFLLSIIFSNEKIEYNSDIAKKIAFFPGAGQIYNKNYLEGFLIFASETYSISQAVKFSRLSNIVSRNLYIWWAIGIYAYSIIDAYVEAELASFPNRDNVLNEKGE